MAFTLYLSQTATTWIIVLSVLFGFVLPAAIGVIMTWPLTNGLYHGWFVRTSPEKYPRDLSCDEPNQRKMYEEGMAFAQIEKAHEEEVTIVHAGLKLAGVYLNYGHEQTVIIIPGRAETVNYSFYFAEIYRKSPFNVLLIDPRGHGLSEGKYNTVGILESGDLLAWSQFLHDEKGQKKIFFHGICIGGASAILALAKPDLPSYIAGAAVEGPFADFEKMFARHVKVAGHLSFPIANELPHYFKKYAKVDIVRDSPEKHIAQVHSPILFLQGKEDIYVPYQDTQRLFSLCPSEKKQWLMFEKGEHSKLRYFNLEKYDSAVLSFFSSL